MKFLFVLVQLIAAVILYMKSMKQCSLLIVHLCSTCCCFVYYTLIANICFYLKFETMFFYRG